LETHEAQILGVNCGYMTGSMAISKPRCGSSDDFF